MANIDQRNEMEGKDAQLQEQKDAKEAFSRDMWMKKSVVDSDLESLQKQPTAEQYFEEGVEVSNRVRELTSQLRKSFESGAYKQDTTAYAKMRGMLEEARRFVHDPSFGVAYGSRIESNQKTTDTVSEMWKNKHVKPLDAIGKMLRGELPIDNKLVGAEKAIRVLDDAGKQEALAQIQQLQQKVAEGGQRAEEIAKSKSLSPEELTRAIERQDSLSKAHDELLKELGALESSIADSMERNKKV